MKKGGGGGKKKRKHTRQSAIVPASAQTYCKTLCSCLRTALTDAWRANTHTVGPRACRHARTCTLVRAQNTHSVGVIQKQPHCSLPRQKKNMQFDWVRSSSVSAGDSPSQRSKSVLMHKKAPRVDKIKDAYHFGILKRSSQFWARIQRNKSQSISPGVSYFAFY